MGSFSIWHWIVVGAIALLLFGGKGKISDLMGDVAKGIKSFKKGMAEDDEVAARPVEPVRTIDNPAVTGVAPVVGDKVPSDTRKAG
ncbi:MAG: twin-arginine translocation protein TatA/E family subunit [Hyphomicrobiales bacterium]|jgi:sec-independent protein translocase protein TatA|nr:twin-arginine translocation protein TatA/E family subunit [Hyphomicrobiales bacterium]